MGRSQHCLDLRLGSLLMGTQGKQKKRKTSKAGGQRPKERFVEIPRADERQQRRRQEERVNPKNFKGKRPVHGDMPRKKETKALKEERLENREQYLIGIGTQSLSLKFKKHMRPNSRILWRGTTKARGWLTHLYLRGQMRVGPIGLN